MIRKLLPLGCVLSSNTICPRSKEKRGYENEPTDGLPVSSYVCVSTFHLPQFPLGSTMFGWLARSLAFPAAVSAIPALSLALTAAVSASEAFSFAFPAAVSASAALLSALVAALLALVAAVLASSAFSLALVAALSASVALSLALSAADSATAAASFAGFCNPTICSSVKSS